MHAYRKDTTCDLPRVRSKLSQLQKDQRMKDLYQVVVHTSSSPRLDIVCLV